MSIDRRLGESEGFEGKGFECILRPLGFVAEWYIDLVDVVGYADVDWPRAVMNRASLPERSPLLSPVRPTRALAHAHAKAQQSSISTVRLNAAVAWTATKPTFHSTCPLSPCREYIFISLPCFPPTLNLALSSPLRRPMLPLHTQHHGYG